MIASDQTNPDIGGLRLRTPEGVDFRIPLAGPGARALALSVDNSVIVGLAGLSSFILKSLVPWFSAFTAIVATLLYLAFSILYSAALEYFWGGQTIGKHLLGLRVMDRDGLRLSGPAVLIRNLLRAVDALPFFYLVGGIATLCNVNSQRLGDRIAGTVVVRPDPAGLPEPDTMAAGKFNSLLAAPLLCMRLRERVRPAQAQLAVDALRARTRLDDQTRIRLYRGVAGMFQSEVEFPADLTTTLSDEQYIRNVVAILYGSPT